MIRFAFAIVSAIPISLCIGYLLSTHLPLDENMRGPLFIFVVVFGVGLAVILEYEHLSRRKQIHRLAQRLSLDFAVSADYEIEKRVRFLIGEPEFRRLEHVIQGNFMGVECMAGDFVWSVDSVEENRAPKIRTIVYLHRFQQSFPLIVLQP